MKMAWSLGVESSVNGDLFRRHTNGKSVSKNCTGGSQSMVCLLYFFIVFVCLGFAGWCFVKLFIVAAVRAAVGCEQDNEGSWAVGVFYGGSPFDLKPVEDNIWKNDGASSPVANPVFTCATVSEAGYPSNFVADPFLFVQGDVIYLFYETKNPITMQGDIGVAKSIDNGVTWKPLGIALDEEWHLSYPYVFEYSGNVYMMPEGSGKGDLRLYRAVEFPLRWKLEKIIMKKPMVDSVMIEHNGKFWIFGSDHSRTGSQKNGELEIWYSRSPLGRWRPHKKNPVHNIDKAMGARNGGRPFVYKGDLYRIGQDCGETYGSKIRIFKIETLTTHEFKEVEVEVPSGIAKSIKGRNAWNGVRTHQLDVQQLNSSKWIAVVDGDRVPSGDVVNRFILGSFAVISALALVILLGMLLGAVHWSVPLSWCPYSLGKRSDTFFDHERNSLLSSQGQAFYNWISRSSMVLRPRIRPNTCTGFTFLLTIFLFAVGLTCASLWYIYGGNGAQEPYPLKGHYSQFTLMAMTYDARLWNLKMYVKHYSRCSSVREIVVIWNKGVPPHLDDFDSTVPVRIRVEKHNSLNNRFKPDPMIKTKGVLELDDDIIMPCSDIERGFLVWRQNPNKIVGFYPRLAAGRTIKYRDESYARKKGAYNLILTGAAFLDATTAFERYSSNLAAEGRRWVDKNFNCEDLLMNFLYANSTTSSVVEYVRPTWVLETSKLSGVAISKNTQAHYDVRSKCLAKFSEIYGSINRRNSHFSWRKDGWDV